MATLNSGLHSISWPVFPISMSWLDELPTAVSGKFKFSERGCVMAGERISAWRVMVTRAEGWFVGVKEELVAEVTIDIRCERDVNRQGLTRDDHSRNYEVSLMSGNHE